MGIAATSQYKEGAYWTHRERKGLGGSGQRRLITTPSKSAIMLQR